MCCFIHPIFVHAGVSDLKSAVTNHTCRNVTFSHLLQVNETYLLRSQLQSRQTTWNPGAMKVAVSLSEVLWERFGQTRSSSFTLGDSPSIPHEAASSSSSSSVSARSSSTCLVPAPGCQVLLTPVVPIIATGHQVGAPVSSPPLPQPQMGSALLQLLRTVPSSPNQGVRGSLRSPVHQISPRPSPVLVWTKPEYDASLVSLPSFQAWDAGRDLGCSQACLTWARTKFWS